MLEFYFIFVESSQSGAMLEISMFSSNWDKTKQFLARDGERVQQKHVERLLTSNPSPI